VSLFPVPFNDPLGPSSRNAAKAQRAQENTYLEVHRYSLGAGARSLMTQYELQAAHDASRVGLDCELDLLDHGLSRTGGSAAKANLVARSVNRLANIDGRIINRRFGV
jgi:hypothetical protein